jgi:ABC-type Zn uptake system ZnuABC Zn-binding protein ZnuA
MRLLSFTVCLLLGLAAVRANERPVVVVTTSLIATAVRDVAGEAVDVETLMAAGTCPGQFDLEPQQARRVRSAALVIRHQFQGFLDARFAAAGISADAVVAPTFEEPLTVPENYVRFCEAVAAEFVRRIPTLAATTGAQLPAIRERALQETVRLHHEAAPLAGIKVVAAAFQAGFLRWLGLEVVAVFST